MSKTEDEIITEAHERFKRCEDFEADSRVLFIEDVRFCNADSDNKYQWPSALSRSRELDARPCLTINKTRQHVLMIQNEIKQNLPSVKISATGGDASYDSAQIFEGVVRYIEYNSNATDAYDTAMTHQVQGGIGYWRIVTDYKDEDSFDQEIFIRRIKDPMSVYLDIDAKEADSSDAKYGFIFDNLTIDEFQRRYPKHKDIGDRAVFNDGNSWIDKDMIRVAEYYYCEYKTDWLVALPIRDPQTQEPIPGQYDTMRLSEIPPQLRQSIKDSEDIKKRKIEARHWKWCMIASNEKIGRAHV